MVKGEDAGNGGGEDPGELKRGMHFTEHEGLR